GNPLKRSFLLTFGKVALASAVMGAALVAGKPLLAHMHVLLQTVLGIGGAALLYAGLLVVMRETILTEMLAKVLRKKGGNTA
ncbi:MAG: hypothetical protein ACM32O_19060, partial [Clostridia bacterium]